jgi:hypothetical protein
VPHCPASRLMMSCTWRSVGNVHSV